MRGYRCQYSCVVRFEKMAVSNPLLIEIKSIVRDVSNLYQIPVEWLPKEQSEGVGFVSGGSVLASVECCSHALLEEEEVESRTTAAPRLAVEPQDTISE